MRWFAFAADTAARRVKITKNADELPKNVSNVVEIGTWSVDCRDALVTHSTQGNVQEVSKPAHALSVQVHFGEQQAGKVVFAVPVDECNGTTLSVGAVLVDGGDWKIGIVNLTA